MTRKRIFLSPPWVGVAERKAVSEAFDSGYVAPCGPMVEAFEKAIARQAGRRYAVAVSGGTAALDLAMAEYGIDGSWTVVAPTLTFIATVGPAWHRGARLVFVDSDETGNMSIRQLERALKTLRTRDPKGKILVIGVDLYGRCCDYDGISALSERFDCTCLIDAAEAVGATYKGRPAGSAGSLGIYSFNGNKIITTSGGGALLTDDAELAARARKRSQQSREPFPWYQHEEVGYNYRMSNLLAAVGLAQLRKLPEILRRRERTWRDYAEHCRVLPSVEGENHWLTVALFDDAKARDAVLSRLAEANIEARPVWKPLHLQPVFAGCEAFGGKTAERLFECGVCLPSGSGLKSTDRARVLGCLG